MDLFDYILVTSLIAVMGIVIICKLNFIEERVTHLESVTFGSSRCLK